MRYLITGIAGFIGFHLARALCLNNCNVVGLDNFCDAYYSSVFKYQRIEQLKFFSNCSIVEGDIQDQALLEKLVQQVDCVIHLAAHASVHYSMECSQDCVHTNELGFVKLLEAIKKRGQHIQHCIYASSSAVYGNSRNFPTRETEEIMPVSIYGMSKYANELAAQIYFQNYGIPLTGLRFFTVYGPWGRPDMAIYRFTQNIWEEESITLFSNGDICRDFIYIDDVVQGILNTIKNPPIIQKRIKHPIYNFGNCHSENLIDTIQIIEKIIGKTAFINKKPLQSENPINTCANIDLAIKKLNFQVKKTLQEGLVDFIDWFSQYKHCEM